MRGRETERTAAPLSRPRGNCPFRVAFLLRRRNIQNYVNQLDSAMTEDERKEKRFDVAVQIRNFEIDLFWKRSVFFWGFIASAFAGFAVLRNSNSDLSIVVACFGMVCSCAWTLLNRGSKFWQECWETKVEQSEESVVGKFFAEEEKERTNKGAWLGARNFSVSKLAIALSDYVFFLWMCLLAAELFRLYGPSNNSRIRDFSIGAFVALSVLYIVLLFVAGRKSPRPETNG